MKLKKAILYIGFEYVGTLHNKLNLEQDLIELFQSAWVKIYKFTSSNKINNTFPKLSLKIPRTQEIKKYF